MIIRNYLKNTTHHPPTPARARNLGMPWLHWSPRCCTWHVLNGFDPPSIGASGERVDHGMGVLDVRIPVDSAEIHPRGKTKPVKMGTKDFRKGPKGFTVTIITIICLKPHFLEGVDIGRVTVVTVRFSFDVKQRSIRRIAFIECGRCAWYGGHISISRGGASSCVITASPSQRSASIEGANVLQRSWLQRTF